jgi:hypothetical protein
VVFDGGAAAADGGVSAPDGADADTTADAGAPDATPPEQQPVARPVGRLAGRVIAKGGRKGLPGISLVAGEAEVGTTDERGEFSVELPCGPRALSIQTAGYERTTMTVDACVAQEPLTVRLAPAEGGAGYETVVRGKPPQPVLRLTEEELTQTPGSLGDPLRVIESLPGVASVAWPAPIYAVRGSNPGNTGYFLDGVRIPALFHFALGPSVIHPYFFRGVDFFPGGYPARYGRYVGGIVSAETQPAATDGLHTSVDVRLFDAGAMVSAPLAGGAVAVAARYSYTGELVTLLGDDVRLQYWDYQLRADRRFGPLAVSLLAFGSGDQFAPSRTDDTQEIIIGFHRVNLRAALPVGGGSLQASIALGTDHSRAPVLDTYPFLVDALSAAPRLAYLHSFSHVEMAVGFDGEFARYEPTVLGGVPQPMGAWDIAERRDARALAGYASATVSAGRVVVTPELRLDTYDVNGTFARDLGPRLTARVALNDETALRASGGRFSQLPNLPLQIPGAEAFGLQLLGLQRSWQGSLGVETTHFAAVELGVTGFVGSYRLTEVRDPSAGNPDPLADDFLTQRDALSYGVELLARRPLTNRLHGWLSYTLSNAVRSYGGGAVGPSDWDQRHIVNLVVGYRFGRNTVGGRAHLNTGRPSFHYDTLGNPYERLPAYYQVDLRFDRRYYFDKFTLNFYVELVNATLNRQVYAITESAPGRLAEHSYRIVLPSIGARAEF